MSYSLKVDDGRDIRLDDQISLTSLVGASTWWIVGMISRDSTGNREHPLPKGQSKKTG
jgi:hypothetical protein